MKLNASENSRGLNCQFGISSCVLLSKKLESFNSRNDERPSFSLPRESNSSFVSINVLTDLRIILSTTLASHCTRMADSVQWLSQSDYSICINLLLEFY